MRLAVLAGGGLSVGSRISSHFRSIWLSSAFSFLAGPTILCPRFFASVCGPRCARVLLRCQGLRDVSSPSAWRQRLGLIARVAGRPTQEAMTSLLASLVGSSESLMFETDGEGDREAHDIGRGLRPGAAIELPGFISILAQPRLAATRTAVR